MTSDASPLAPRPLQRVCIFCGASSGDDPIYLEAARATGRLLAERGLGVVYGGGGIGLMGAVADSARAAGGEVIGVIPQHLLDWEVGHSDLTDTRVVANMHERKATMAELADAFIALPGGIGTMEEFFEVWTWGQLKLHEKPCGLLNVAGYFDHLLGFLDTMVAHRFLHERHRHMIQVDGDIGSLVDRLQLYAPPVVERWFDKSKT